MPVFDYLLNALVRYLKRRRQSRQKRDKNKSRRVSGKNLARQRTSRIKRSSQRKTGKSSQFGFWGRTNGKIRAKKRKQAGSIKNNSRPGASHGKNKHRPHRYRKNVLKRPAERSPSRANDRKRLKIDITSVFKAEPQALPGERIGVITHYFPRIQVVVLKMTSGALSVGETIHIRGKNGGFDQKVESLQIESVDVKTTRKGQLVGLKVAKKALPGDQVFKIK